MPEVTCLPHLPTRTVRRPGFTHSGDLDGEGAECGAAGFASLLPFVCHSYATSKRFTVTVTVRRPSAPMPFSLAWPGALPPWCRGEATAAQRRRLDAKAVRASRLVGLRVEGLHLVQLCGTQHPAVAEGLEEGVAVNRRAGQRPAASAADSFMIVVSTWRPSSAPTPGRRSAGSGFGSSHPPSDRRGTPRRVGVVGESAGVLKELAHYAAAAVIALAADGIGHGVPGLRSLRAGRRGRDSQPRDDRSVLLLPHDPFSAGVHVHVRAPQEADERQPRLFGHVHRKR